MSIWHKASEKPKSFSFILEHHKAYDFDNHKVITAYNVFETGGNPQNPFDENTIRWCHLDDLIAQADKAERLQKQIDSLKKYSDSLRHRVEKMLKKNKTLRNTAANYFMKSVELGIELEKTKSNN